MILQKAPSIPFLSNVLKARIRSKENDLVRYWTMSVGGVVTNYRQVVDCNSVADALINIPLHNGVP